LLPLYHSRPGRGRSGRASPPCRTGCSEFGPEHQQVGGGGAAAPGTNDHHTLCMKFEEMHAVEQTAHSHGMKVTGHCRATEGIKNGLKAGYDTLEHGTFMDDEALEMLLKRNTSVVPALQFEWASIERGPEFGMPRAVIDGHKEALEGGAESD